MTISSDLPLINPGSYKDRESDLNYPNKDYPFESSTPPCVNGRRYPGTPSTERSFDSYQSRNDSPTLRSKPKPIPSFLKRKVFSSIGSSWTVEMSNLQLCGSYFEAVLCLRRIRELLNEIDYSDRIKFCKKDYARSTSTLKKRKQLWSDDLFREVVSIELDYFNQSVFARIPTDVMLEIFHWLPISDVAPLFSVCWEWHETVSSDKLWRLFYQQKYLDNNPGIMPNPREDKMIDMRTAFKVRLDDPQIGDTIEVSWRGKFRLETEDVYQGLAWWVALVVDKHEKRYKIRYPGWEARWDEWVPRQRLRWKVTDNTIVKINVNDIVELWCCGANVPGAWLESKVKRVRNGRYCIGGLSSGHLWVDRDRLRLVRAATVRCSGMELGDRNTPYTWHGRAHSLVGYSLGYVSTIPGRMLRVLAPILGEEEDPSITCTIT